MTPDRWQQVKGLFDQAMECEPARRDVFLREACAGDEELHEELVSLVRYGTAGGFLEEAAVRAESAEDRLIGRVFGVYRIVRHIGRGGMGSVYLATRDDDQFRRRVALKIIKPELADLETLRRFQNERQALAVLDHPNIIKLLDGGQSEDGSPYLVMDYVEGSPLDEYCDSHGLDIRERLELFRTVCAAVHYAHQNLVVHRDLKPGNILITAQGVPKLLDFGIAKLLRPEYSAQAIGLTRTRTQPMTPKYASPEQVLGQPITTASDIYALGVLLYELLTGQHPFERQVHTELDLENAIVDLDPERPSVAATRLPASGGTMARHFRGARPKQLARLLSGDLDTIVLMAMRKEPQRRYASADHLAEDLGRHLKGLPVLARNATAQYRLAKFIRRHKLGVAAGMMVAASIVASTFVAYRAHLRTDRMFQQAWLFDKFLINDLDKVLTSGEGVTAARQAMLAQAVDSLDHLAAESKDDPVLKKDLIDAYIKMGDVQGNPSGANLGEKRAAEESYRKALNLAESLWKAHPSDTGNRLQVAGAYGKLADLLDSRREAVGQYQEALKIYRLLPPTDPNVQKGLMHCQDRLGSTQEQIGALEGALETYQDLLKRERAQNNKAAVAFLGERVAYFSALNGLTEGAEEMAADSIDFYRHATGKRAANPRNVAVGLVTLAQVQRRKGKIDAALANVRESLSITSALQAKDPHDRRKQIDYEQGMVLLIDLLSASGQKDLQRQETARALHFVKPLLDQPETSDYQVHDYASILVTTPFPELQDRAAALKYAKKAVEMTGQSDLDALDILARAYDQNGDPRQAVETETKALGLLQPLPAGARPSELRATLQTNLQAFQRQLAGKN